MSKSNIVKINENIFIWKWKDSKGNFYEPKNMETRHLFFTLRMIWNHSMDIKLEPYKKYVFSSFYTAEYMRDALFNIGTELFTRTDINPTWQNDLDKMTSHFQKTRRLNFEE